MVGSGRASGFTLIEMMITISVVAILLAVGLPSFRSIIQNSRSAALATDLTSAINLARAEAVRRSEAVSVCPSTNGTACGGTWNDGWIVRVNSGGEVLRVWEALEGGQITQTPAANTALEFGALGQLTSGAGSFLASVNGCIGERARALAVNAAGRVSVNRDDCP